MLCRDGRRFSKAKSDGYSIPLFFFIVATLFYEGDDQIILNRYKKMPVVARASFWAFFCNALQKGIVFLTTPIITRMLSTQDYGRYSVIVSYADILTIFGTLALYQNGYNVGMKRYYKDGDRYTASIAGLMIVLTTLCILIGRVARRWFSVMLGLEPTACLLLAVWMYGQGAVSLWYAQNRYEFKYRMIVACTVFTATATPLLKIALIWWAAQTGADQATAAILGQTLPIAVVGLVAWAAIFSKSHGVWKQEYWRFAIGFNIPLIPYYLSQTILNQADRIMIERMVSASAAGIYSVAYSAAMAVSIVNQAVNASFTPWQFQQMQYGHSERVAKTVNLLIGAVASLHLLVIFIAPEIIRVFAAKDYAGAVYGIPPVTVSVLLAWLTQVFINVEFYYEKNRLISLSSVLSAVLNVVLNALAIPRFGYLAAAYTTLICFFSNLVFHGAVAVRLTRRMRTTPAFDLKKISTLTAISIVCSFAILPLYGLSWIRYILLFAACTAAFFMRKRLGASLLEMYRSVREKTPAPTADCSSELLRKEG